MAKKGSGTGGEVALVLGLFLVIFNSIDYFVGWHKVPTEVSFLGIALLAIGVWLTKKK
ncbi:MAG: hypothetical protein ABIG96_05110 [Candidatus Micrarchaeota archaeon]